MRIFIGGVNASGKSTILKKVADISGYPVLHGAGLLMEQLNCSGDYEKLRAISAEEKGKAYTQVVEKLCAKENNFLLDSHYLTLIRGEVTNMTSDRLKNFDLLVLISTPIEILWKRLQSDPRDRALFPIDAPPEVAKKILEDYQMETLKAFDRAVKEYDVPGIHIHNDENNVEKAVKELYNLILNSKK